MWRYEHPPRLRTFERFADERFKSPRAAKSSMTRKIRPGTPLF